MERNFDWKMSGSTPYLSVRVISKGVNLSGDSQREGVLSCGSNLDDVHSSEQRNLCWNQAVGVLTGQSTLQSHKVMRKECMRNYAKGIDAKSCKRNEFVFARWHFLLL
jgi:hypothetical protein